MLVDLNLVTDILELLSDKEYRTIEEIHNKLPGVTANKLRRTLDEMLARGVIEVRDRVGAQRGRKPYEWGVE